MAEQTLTGLLVHCFVLPFRKTNQLQDVALTLRKTTVSANEGARVAIAPDSQRRARRVVARRGRLDRVGLLGINGSAVTGIAPKTLPPRLGLETVPCFACSHVKMIGKRSIFVCVLRGKKQPFRDT